MKLKKTKIAELKKRFKVVENLKSVYGAGESCLQFCSRTCSRTQNREICVIICEGSGGSCGDVACCNLVH